MVTLSLLIKLISASLIPSCSGAVSYTHLKNGCPNSLLYEEEKGDEELLLFTPTLSPLVAKLLVASLTTRPFAVSTIVTS